MHSSKCNPVRIKVSEKSLNIPFLITITDLTWVSLRLSRKNQSRKDAPETHRATQTVGFNINFVFIFNKVKLTTSLQGLLTLLMYSLCV